VSDGGRSMENWKHHVASSRGACGPEGEHEARDVEGQRAGSLEREGGCD
jgi:hypothetical protein